MGRVLKIDRHRFADQALDGLDIRALVGHGKGHRPASEAGSSGPANSVDVIFGIGR